MMVVTFLSLLTLIPYALSLNGACVPNTQFVLNSRICHCRNIGRWTEANCLPIGRRASCLAGQIIWQGCSQCICQETGQLMCSNAGCYDDVTYKGITTPSTRILGDASNSWCTPFKSYYINCSICVCPASGKTSEAHCAKDNSCQRLPPSSSDFLQSVNKNICIPNVMYLFPCLHCLCSDGGYFVLEKCVETCHRPQSTESYRRCISNTFYRKNCNVCWCPNDSIPDDKLCTKAHCAKNSKFTSLNTLKTSREKCRPYSFLKPKCFYCGCNTQGNINENACLELECLKFNDFKYDVTKTTCSPGEMIPICVECFCLNNGVTNKTYCTNVCSYQSKLSILEKVLKDSTIEKSLIDREDIFRTSDSEQCTPNSMYSDHGRYCLCPENGSTNFKLCTSVTEEIVTSKSFVEESNNTIRTDLNKTCTPNTFVEIDCNTCYCAKNGKIDPRWCTYDDCNAKKIIQDTHKNIRVSTIPPPFDGVCVPGSISKQDCNFCICPESGILKEQACTKNKCSEIQEDMDDEKFVCEPLNYYLVDCNVCLCPRDGIKNVAKCTKKICEKPFLRSNSCVPGQFFCNDCNVCVCPPNGDKADKACTNHTCSDSDTPWKKIFRLSQSLLDNRVSLDGKIQLDVCFSGEEFEIGCKICVCPDIGLRSYAICTESRCEEQNTVYATFRARLSVTSSPKQKHQLQPQKTELVAKENVEVANEHPRVRRDLNCFSFNLSDSAERKACTPGSMYIIRCQQCICPYIGNINYFCRPLPKGTFCEQAYPNYNFASMGRRIEEVTGNQPSAQSSTPFVPMNHEHTVYTCSTPGPVSDECFVCECERARLVEEHCFRSERERCERARPSFLDANNKVVIP